MLIKKFYSKYLFGFILFSVFTAFNAPFIASVVQEFVQMASQKDLSKLQSTLLLTVSGILLFMVAGIIKNYFRNHFIQSANQSIKKATLSASLKARDASLPSDLLGFLTGDLKLLEEKGLKAELSMISYALMFLFSLTASVRLDLWTTLTFFVGAFISASLSMLGHKKISTLTDNWSTSVAFFTEHSEESLKNKKTINLFNASSVLFNRLNQAIRQMEGNLFRLNFTIDRNNQIVEAMTEILSISIPFSIGVYRICQGQLNVAQFITVMQLSNTVIMPILMIMQLSNDHASVKPILKKYDRFTQLPEMKVTETADFAQLELTCPYKNGEVAFRLAKGEKVLIKGPSGIGKSSLFHELIFPHQAKAYQIDGQEVEKDSYLTRLYTTASQATDLFESSILFNITLGQDFKEEAIQRVLRLADLEAFYAEKGPDYQIEKAGANLSGGEAQRIGLARALLRQRPILLLDEITAALDPKRAMKIRENIWQEIDTFVEIAHHTDPAYEERFDRVIEMV